MRHDLAIAQLEPVDMLDAEVLSGGRNCYQHSAIHRKFSDAEMCPADHQAHDYGIAASYQFENLRAPVREGREDIFHTASDTGRSHRHIEILGIFSETMDIRFQVTATQTLICPPNDYFIPLLLRAQGGLARNRTSRRSRLLL